jgi:hypothetical protein
VTQQVHHLDDYMAHARTLLDDYVAHGRLLRALHEQYLALRHEAMSDEQRREAYRQIRHTELDVLAEARFIHEAFQALLTAHQSRLRSGKSSSD